MMTNKLCKGVLCLSLLLSTAIGAQAQNVKLTPEFCQAGQQYDVVQTFYDGRAAVLKNGNWGYINTDGKEVIPCQIPMLPLVLYFHPYEKK